MPVRDANGRFVRTTGWKMTIIALGNANVSMKVAEEAAIKASGAVLLSRVHNHASRTDHTLAQLAAKDHPYAKRHPAILAGALGPDFVKRPYLVHTRSGDFKRAIRGKFTGRSASQSARYDVVAHPDVPWVRYVIQGTRKMHGRDIIWQTALEPETKVAIMKVVVAVLGKGLRTQAAVRFS